jgi:dCMP deaminase
MNWDTILLNMAEVIAQKSKDPSTKVGAIVVSNDNRAMTCGYNGFPAGACDSVDIWKNREKTDNSLCKYDLVIHAEMNAIFNAPFSVRGCKLYVTHKPCQECIKNIAGAGIKEVHYYLDNRCVAPHDLKTTVIAMYCGVELIGHNK